MADRLVWRARGVDKIVAYHETSKCPALARTILKERVTLGRARALRLLPCMRCSP
jgi:hypothetical protein